ncbi:MAG: DUF4097 family beta strand repeat protein [Oscillospiraceae bacterium]|nr:DUF4097 family beta strand repeat protein [Oscillospiraceae bacterium]
MRKGSKILITVGCAMLVLGIVLVLIGDLMDGGFQIRLKGSSKVEAMEKVIDEPVSAVVVDEISADVEVRLSEDRNCRIEYAQSEREPLEITVKNGKLTLERKNRSNFPHFFSLGFDSQKMEKMDSTVLYLPPSVCQTLHVETVSGSIQLASSLPVETVELSAVSGSIQAKELTPKRLSLEAVSGALALEEVRADEKISCETTSGDIRLTRCDAQELTLESVSGDITAELLTAKQIHTDTVSGDVEAPSSDASAGTCRAETVSGDITIRIP